MNSTEKEQLLTVKNLKILIETIKSNLQEKSSYSDHSKWNLFVLRDMKVLNFFSQII